MKSVYIWPRKEDFLEQCTWVTDKDYLVHINMSIYIQDIFMIKCFPFLVYYVNNKLVTNYDRMIVSWNKKKWGRKKRNRSCL